MQQALRADTLLDSIVIKAFSHDRIEGAWQRLVVIGVGLKAGTGNEEMRNEEMKK